MTVPAGRRCRCGCEQEIHRHYYGRPYCGRCGPGLCARFREPARLRLRRWQTALYRALGYR